MIGSNRDFFWQQDYIAHAQAIEDKYGDNSDKGHTSAASETKSAPIMAPTAAAAPFAGFNMTAKPTAPAPATAPASASSAPFSGFSFGTKPAEAATVPAPAVPASSAPFGGFTFGTKPEATAPVPAAASTATSAPFAGFSFSAKPAPAAAAAPAATTASSAPFSGFTFGTPATATAPAAPPATSFSSSFTFGGTALGGAPAAAAAMPSFGGFGASAVPAMAATAVGGVAGGEDEEGGGDEEGEPILEPEKVLRNAADTDEILHEVPCKLFSFSTADKEWKDTGKGTFRITRDPATQKQRMLVRNQVGRINFNASFFAAMKVEKVGKKLKFAAFVSVEAPALNSEGKTTTRTEMKNFMIQLKPEDLDATQRVMEAGIKASG